MDKAVVESPTGVSDPARLRVRILGSLLGCHTINDFYGLIMPPMLPAIRESFGLDYFAVGIIPFLTLVTSALLQPTLGYLADRRGLRRVFMTAGFLAIAVAMAGLGQAQTYAAVLAAAVCLGIGASTYHPQSATLLAYYFERQRRGFAQGIHGIGNAVGFVLAPTVMFFLLRQTTWNHAATWVALPALAGAAIAFIGLREPALRGSRGLLAGVNRPLILLTVINGFALASSSGFTNWLPSYYHLHNYTLSDSALLAAATSGAAIIAQPLGGSISDRVGRRTLLVVALTGVAVSLVAFLLAPSIEIAIGLSVVVGFWASLMPPVMMVYASELAAGERTGTAVGIVWGMATTMSAVTLPVTGRIIDLAGGQIAPAYGTLAVLAVIAALLATRLPRR